MKKRCGFDDIPLQAGRTVIVTGANSGLGYEAALMLARRGAEVILACRSQANAEKAMEEMRKAYPSETLNLTFARPLDLADLESVEAFAREITAKYSHIDILVNNAGVMVPPLTRTAQGFELQFGVNHLGQAFTPDCKHSRRAHSVAVERGCIRRSYQADAIRPEL